MGYCMDLVGGSFHMKKENFNNALNAIKELVENGQQYSWVNSDTISKANDLFEAVREWGWSVHTDVNGDIDDIDFDAEKMGDDEILFNAIALFVKDDSYINMRGEDGEGWKWYFKDGECHTFDGETKYKTLDDDYDDQEKKIGEEGYLRGCVDKLTEIQEYIKAGNGWSDIEKKIENELLQCEEEINDLK